MSGKNGMSKLPRDLEVSMKSGAIMSTPPTEWGQIGPICPQAFWALWARSASAEIMRRIETQETLTATQGFRTN